VEAHRLQLGSTSVVGLLGVDQDWPAIGAAGAVSLAAVPQAATLAPAPAATIVIALASTRRRLANLFPSYIVLRSA
jgi:hypothetical protein